MIHILSLHLKNSFGQSSGPRTTVRLFKAIHDIYNIMIMLTECDFGKTSKKSATFWFFIQLFGPLLCKIDVLLPQLFSPIH